MIRSALSKVVWMARATTVVVGLAIMLGLIFGLATSAFGANGGNFILGSLNNTATAITKLTGTVGGGPALQVSNPSTATGSTALDLQVATGKAPMKVNRTTKVTNLNADLLDGKDSSAFFVGRTYLITAEFNVPAGLGTSIGFGCDGGDVALSGGYEGAADGTHIASNGPNPGAAGSWAIQANNNSGPDDSIIARVRCADFPPTHIP
jgi:hypothetical protein